MAYKLRQAPFSARIIGATRGKKLPKTNLGFFSILNAWKKYVETEKKL